MEILKLNPKYFDLVVYYVPKIVIAIIILLIGLWIIGKLTITARHKMTRYSSHNELLPFLISLFNILMKLFLIMGVANIVGIQTTSFVAILASAAFAVGLALQGTLSNFAAGVMILFFKPYQIGDFIEVQNVSGRVKEIQIFNTLITTGFGKITIVPNSTIMNGIIGNLTIQKTIKTNIQVPVKYGTDFNQLKQIIMDILRGMPEVLKEPITNIDIDVFQGNGYIVTVAAAIHAENLEKVSKELREKIYVELSKATIQMG